MTVVLGRPLGVGKSNVEVSSKVATGTGALPAGVFAVLATADTITLFAGAGQAVGITTSNYEKADKNGLNGYQSYIKAGLQIPVRATLASPIAINDPVKITNAGILSSAGSASLNKGVVRSGVITDIDENGVSVSYQLVDFVI